MSDIDSPRSPPPPGRPSTPRPSAAAVAYYEFLLNENLLEEHLCKENPDPTAMELINQFLHQADAAITAAKEAAKDPGNNAAEPRAGEQTEAKTDVENRKCRALRLLALKTAAYLKWNLSLLDKSLPLTMTQMLLVELLKVVSVTLEPLEHTQMDPSCLPDQVIFALQLYHRWCVGVILRNRFISRPTKTAPVQIPGLVDPMTQIAAANDTIFKSVSEYTASSITLLEMYLKMDKPVTMPTLRSFGSLDEETDMATHKWDQGVSVPSEEWICQICHDLGSFYFLQENYSKAYEMFSKTVDIFQQLKDPVFCSIDKGSLLGYYSACCHLQGETPTKILAPLSIWDQVQAAKANDYKSIVDLLIQDNCIHELSVFYRNTLENDIKATQKSEELDFLVLTCNTVRRSQEGEYVSHQFIKLLNSRGLDAFMFLTKVLSETMKSSNFTEKTNLKCLMRYVVQTLPQGINWRQIILQGDLRPHFSQADLNQMSTFHNRDMTHKGIMVDHKVNHKGDSVLVFGEMERQLLNSYDPALIRDLIAQMKEKFNSAQIRGLSQKWAVPREMQYTIDMLETYANPEFIFILIAKARHCMQMKVWRKARHLLTTVDTSVKDFSYKLSKMVRWEVLMVDIMQYHDNHAFCDGVTLQDITKRCKTCITTLTVEKETNPSVEIVHHCVTFLLTIRDWEYLGNLKNFKNGYIEFTRLLSDTCKELPIIRNSRKPGKDLWEAVVQIYMNGTQQKRSISGASTMMQRENQMGLLSQQAFLDFLQKIREPVALTALISCITKLYNILKDDITSEISSDYILLWPTALNCSHNVINLAAVSDAVSILMDHALCVNSANTSWLKTQADICYAHGQHASALKYYLEAGVVATHFFSLPVPRSVFDDQVYRRMMKCCSYMQCHVQMAIFSQFLEETDYTTAFKALQEKNSHDAMDTYYEYIWDVTILEYLTHVHTKRGELEKKQQALKAIGQLELNSSNPEEILQQAAHVRKTRFLLAMAKLYL